MAHDMQQIKTRIKRFTLDKSLQDQLLAELERADEKQIEKLVDLLDQHDAECLKVLDQKLREQEKIQQEVAPQMDKKIPALKLEGEKIEAFLNDIFSSLDNFAEFLVSANDQIIEAVEKIILNLVPEENKAGVKKLFEQARVHKANVERQEDHDYKQALISEIELRESQIRELDEIMAQVEKERTAAQK